MQSIPIPKEFPEKQTKILLTENISTYKTNYTNRIEEYKNKISKINSLLYESNKDFKQRSSSFDINNNSERNNICTNIDFINFEFDSDSELHMDSNKVEKISFYI